MMLAIMRGEWRAGRARPRCQDVIEAAKWLMDRGYGKAPDIAVTVNNSVQVDTAKAPEEKSISELRAELARLRAMPLETDES
jgi:hypothetical protein